MKPIPKKLYSVEAEMIIQVNQAELTFLYCSGGHCAKTMHCSPMLKNILPTVAKVFSSDTR
jgi:hypothetical protein